MPPAESLSLTEPICEVCFTSSWVPVPAGAEGALPRPDFPDAFMRCDYCWLQTRSLELFRFQQNVLESVGVGSPIEALEKVRAYADRNARLEIALLGVRATEGLPDSARRLLAWL